ncbi:MAG: hypothetical protein AAFR93_14980, partial [Pseudomonadota bacterium]
FKPQTDRASALFSMAQTLADRPMRIADGFGAYRTCDGPTSSWATLSAERLDSSTLPDLTAGLEALPPVLRQELGARLSMRLVEEDLIDAAQTVLSVLRRSPGMPAETRELASIAASFSEASLSSQGLETLADLAQQESDLSPQGLILLAERLEPDRSQEAAALSRQVVEDLDIARRLHAPHPPADALTIAQANLMARMGLIEEALSVLVDTPYLSNQQSDAAVGNILLGSAPGKLGDAAFARLALTYLPDLLSDAAGTDLRRRLIDHLLEIGLPNAALDLAPRQNELTDQGFNNQITSALARPGVPSTDGFQTHVVRSNQWQSDNRTAGRLGRAKGGATEAGPERGAVFSRIGEPRALATPTALAMQLVDEGQIAESFGLSDLRAALENTQRLRGVFEDALKDLAQAQGEQGL